MTPEIDIEQARKSLAQREAAYHSRLQLRLAQARRDFQAIADLVATKYRPRRIYQWGSLLEDDHFSEISDIDIAVEGIRSAEEYFAMLGDAMNLTEFPLDLVDLEKIEPLHAAGIRQRGRVVYEAEKTNSAVSH